MDVEFQSECKVHETRGNDTGVTLLIWRGVLKSPAKYICSDPPARRELPTPTAPTNATFLCLACSRRQFRNQTQPTIMPRVATWHPVFAVDIRRISHRKSDSHFTGVAQTQVSRADFTGHTATHSSLIIFCARCPTICRVWYWK